MHFSFFRKDIFEGTQSVLGRPKTSAHSRRFYFIPRLLKSPPRAPQKHLSCERKVHDGAFTLVELLLSMVIISALVVCVAYLIIIAMNSYSLITDRREVLQEARLAVNMMTNELSTITSPATDISAISSTSITFTPSGGGSPVTYSISGSNLMRNADVLATNVTALTGFIYYTTGGAVTNNATQVHRIHISVEVDTGATARGKINIQSNVYLRNRYYNAFTKI